MRMKKSECTPEQWDAYKAYMREWYARQPNEKKETYKERAVRWNKENPERRVRIRRGEHYRRKYGMTLEDYESRLESQAGKCLVCGDKPNHILNVDHCHETGRVRGLVCSPCNTAIGHIERHAGLLDAMKEYLLH